VTTPAAGVGTRRPPGDSERSARSQRAHDAVLVAATGLLAEGGLPAATVDAISARSGVSKATIYRHWPNRTAVAAEAFGRQMAQAVQPPDTGSARGDLSEQVRRVSRFYASDSGRVFAQLLAACVDDPEASAYFRKFFLTEGRRAIAELWRRGLTRDEVRSDVDAETATDILFGPLIFRLLSGHMPLNDEQADAICAGALRGLLKPDS
jgi:AcrR family transcriptional regulator